MNAKANSSHRKNHPSETDPRKKTPRTPSLRHHKATGQGYVVLNGRAIYLGRFGEAETTQRYHQLMAEWMANGKQVPGDPECITIKELIAQFWIYAENYYCKSDGKLSSEIDNFKVALKLVNELYGTMRAMDFSPRYLRAVRQKMIEKGWCRRTINRSISRIRLVFRWATERELISGSVLYALRAVAGLRRGRSEAREPEPVKPVPQNLIDAIEPYVSHQVWTLVQLQLLMAARAGELVLMRPRDIDRSGKIWVYTPTQHKTAHYGYERKIYIGPRGQAVLTPFLLRSHDTYCFSPAEAETERRAKAHAARKTPLQYGNRPGTNRQASPEQKIGDYYEVAAYRRVITRGCDRAFPPPQPLDEKERKAWQKVHRWHPHQLRHNAATNLRKEFGLEAARIILGHRSAAITEVYAELDQQKAKLAAIEEELAQTQQAWDQALDEAAKARAAAEAEAAAPGKAQSLEEYPSRGSATSFPP